MKKKLKDIRNKQKEELKMKGNLGVLLKTSKDNLYSALNELESSKETAQRIRYVNKKSKTD